MSILNKYEINQSNKPKRSFIGKTLYFIDYFFSIIQKKYKVLLIDSYFNSFAFLRISLSLGQLPRKFYEFGEHIDLESPRNDRFNIKLDLDSSKEVKFFFVIIGYFFFHKLI